MQQTNLKNSPEYVEKTLQLIENSFGYNSSQHFNIDFYPLYNPENFPNCHILVENDEVIAHIGTRDGSFRIGNQTFPVRMYGGIAIAEAARGKGLFKNFFQKILSLDENSCLSILWSEKLELYQKFDFYPCVQLNSYAQTTDQNQVKYKITQTKLYHLTESQKLKIYELYNNTSEIRLERNHKSWKMLEEITSSELYLISENDEIINYFFKGKGQDLTNIIHEYGKIDEYFLRIMQAYGDVWTPFLSKGQKFQALFGSVWRINNQKTFEQLLNHYCEIQIKNFSDDLIDFRFQGEAYDLENSEFMLGVFGPGRFREIQKPYFFISGLDSI